MAILIDTDIAIHLRDGEPSISGRLAEAGIVPVISAVTLAELEGDAARDESTGRLRRRLLDEMLGFVRVLPFTSAEAAVYGRIVAALGHDRRRVLDRMIAAQAIAARLKLVTVNGRDFRKIPDLALEVWPAPGA